MLDPNEIGLNVLHNILQRLGYDPENDDSDTDPKVLVKVSRLSFRDAMDHYLAWNGIIGFTADIIYAYETLKKAEEEAKRQMSCPD